ncbi:MAG: phospho-N-acetylmuramoyl-pentapeptide-transferase [Clostridia bacterium]|nr:phospho-N-acetylmuramoyl-pentapeptide-transferase [Clostridia bacterium]
MIVKFFIAMIICFVGAAVLGRIFIPVLKSYKIGQKIREIGPRWHKSKEGTPIMGGLFFIVPVILTMLVYTFVCLDFSEVGVRFLLCLALALANGAIGFVDDARKLFKKQNEGLKAGEKFMLQLIAAALYLLGMAHFGGLTTELYIPFVGTHVELGNFYYVIALLVIVGVTNAANLTDGIDGLASSITAVVSAFFAVSALVAANECAFYLAGALFGGCLGFLVYNLNPARIFMGDTGSLFLGGAVCALAFLMDNPLIILVAGIVYIAEAASVMLQVSYFKITKKITGEGKRLFKMSPIHHHFERSGWSENKIVVVFCLVSAAACTLAYIFG